MCQVQYSLVRTLDGVLVRHQPAHVDLTRLRPLKARLVGHQLQVEEQRYVDCIGRKKEGQLSSALADIHVLSAHKVISFHFQLADRRFEGQIIIIKYYAC